MGILESIFGTAEPPTDEELSESTIDLPRDEYTTATPVAVRRSRLEDILSVIETDHETPVAETAYGQQTNERINEYIDDIMPDHLDWEGHSKEVDLAENIINKWLGDVSGEIGVVFVRHTDTFRLGLFLQGCEERAKLEHDPFELPSNFDEATSFLKRLKKKHDAGDAAVIRNERVATRE